MHTPSSQLLFPLYAQNILPIDAGLRVWEYTNNNILITLNVRLEAEFLFAEKITAKAHI